MREAATGTGTFEHAALFLFSLNVQAELNIVRNFGLFSPEMKAFGETKVREERFDFITAFAFINTLLCVLLGTDIPLELSYNQ